MGKIKKFFAGILCFMGIIGVAAAGSKVSAATSTYFEWKNTNYAYLTGTTTGEKITFSGQDSIGNSKRTITDGTSVIPNGAKVESGNKYIKISKGTSITFEVENAFRFKSNTFANSSGNSNLSLKKSDGTNNVEISIGGSKSNYIFDSGEEYLSAGVYTYGSGAELNVYEIYIEPRAGEMLLFTFDLNYTDSSKIDSSVESGKTVTRIDDPKREGYIFDGWYSTSSCDGEQFDFTTPITTETTVYAKWLDESTVTKYNVNFVVNGESVGTQVIKENGTISQFPTYEDTTYQTFEGWFDGDTKYTEETLITKDVTLVGKYVDKTVITYLSSNYLSSGTNKDVDYKVDDNFTFIAFSQDKSPAIQAAGVKLTIKDYAEITVVVAQTGSDKNRSIGVTNSNGTKLNVYNEPNEDGKTYDSFTYKLGKGTYTFISVGATSHERSGYMNWKSVTVNYDVAKPSVLLEAQAATIDEAKAVRFLATLGNIALEDISSIEAVFTLDGVQGKEIIFSTVYTSVKDTKAAVENTYYAVYTITGFNEAYTGKVLTGKFIITLVDGSTLETNVVTETI